MRRRLVSLLIAGAALAALLIQLNPAWRDSLIYERQAVSSGQLWRLWSGHWVHFGWPHFMADSVFFLIVGLVAAQKYPRFTCTGLGLMPLFVSLCLYWLDPGMNRYAGLSALNLGLLLYLAFQGWQRDKRGWFWPCVVALFVADVIYSTIKTTRGGGLIPFDDPSVKVATSAHIAAAVYALLAWGIGHCHAQRNARR